MQNRISRIVLTIAKRVRHLAGVLTVPALLMTTPARVSAQSTCESTRLLSATDEYDYGRFFEAIRIIRPCVPNGFGDKTETIDAYRLLALSYLASDSLDHARQSVVTLLRYDSRFRPNPQYDPPMFVNLVKDIKPRWYTWMWRGSEWYKWAGRGLFVGAAVGIPLIVTRQLPLLPDPPLLPSSPGH